jgi:hypothetical protein
VAKFNKLQNNFKSGQLSQLLDGRTDLNEYRNGLKTMKNAFPMRQGGAQKRPGTKFIADLTANLKDSLKGNAMKMIPFTIFDKTKYIFILVADTTKQNSEEYVESHNMLLKEVNGEFVDVTATEYSLWDSIVSGATNDTLKNVHYTVYGNEVFFARGYNSHTTGEFFATPATLYGHYPEVSVAAADVDFSNNKFLLLGTTFNTTGITDLVIDAGNPTKIKEVDHGLKTNQRIKYTAGANPIKIPGGLPLPNGYYFVNRVDDDYFYISDTKGGASRELVAALFDDNQTWQRTIQHAFVNGEEVQLFNDQNPVDLPNGLAENTSYYVKRIQDDEIELYDDSDLSTLSTFTDAGTGTHVIEAVNYKWKFHTFDQFITDANGIETELEFERNIGLARPYLADNLISTASIQYTSGSPDTFTLTGFELSPDHVGAYFILNNEYIATIKEAIFRIDKVTSATTAEVSFIAGSTANLASTVTWRESAWSGYRGYPGTITNYEGRLIFGGTDTQPGITWLSKTEDITVFMQKRLFQDEGTNDDSKIVFFDAYTPADPKEYGYKDSTDKRITFLNQGRALEVGTSKDVKILNAPDGLGGEVLGGQIPYYTLESQTGAAAIQPARADQSTLYSEVLIGISNFTLDTEIETRDRYISKQLSLLNEEIIKGDVELFYYDSFKRILYIVLKDNGRYILRGLYFDNVDETAAWFQYDYTEFVDITDVYSVAGFDESPHTYLLTTRKQSGGLDQIYLEKSEGATTKLLEAELDYLDLHVNGDAAQATRITGLDHLYELKDADNNNVTITVLANIEFDNNKPDRYITYPNLTIQFDGGSSYYVDLPAEIEEYVAGVPYTAELETMIIDGGLNVEGSSQGQVKRVDEVTLRMWNTTNLEIGDSNDTFPVKFDDDSLYTGDKVVKFDQGPRTDNRIKIMSNEAKPMFLTGIITKGVTYE